MIRTQIPFVELIIYHHCEIIKAKWRTFKGYKSDYKHHVGSSVILIYINTGHHVISPNLKPSLLLHQGFSSSSQAFPISLHIPTQ